MIARDQLLGGLRAFHTLANAVGDVGRKLFVCGFVQERFGEVAKPDPEADVPDVGVFVEDHALGVQPNCMCSRSPNLSATKSR